MSTYTLAPVAVQQFIDENGAPYAGGFLTVKLAGTNTLATVYSDSVGTPNTNPIVLNDAGYVATNTGATCGLFLSASTFDFYLEDAASVPVWGPLRVPSVGLIASGVYAIFDFGGDSDAPVTNTSYTAGTTFTSCHTGTAEFVIDSANLAPGTYELAGMLLSSDGIITVTAALMNLSDGADTTPLATIASTSSTGARVVSSAISFAAVGTSKRYAIKTKVSGGYGLAWGLQLVKVD